MDTDNTQERWETYYRPYRPNESFNADSLEAFVVSYHNTPGGCIIGENTTNHLRITTVWDASEFDDLLHDCGIGTYNLADETSTGYLDTAFAKRFQHIAFYDADTARQGYVFNINGRATDLFHQAVSMIRTLRSDSYWGHGDDGHEDYAPDEVELIYQMLKACSCIPTYTELAATEWSNFWSWLGTGYTSPYKDDLDDHLSLTW